MRALARADDRAAAVVAVSLTAALDELERNEPAVRAAADAYDRTVWRLNMRARVQLRHLFALMAGVES